MNIEIFTELFDTRGKRRATAIDHLNPVETTVGCIFVFRFLLQLSYEFVNRMKYLFFEARFIVNVKNEIDQIRWQT